MFGFLQKPSRNLSRYLWSRVHFHHSLSRKSVKFKYEFTNVLYCANANCPVQIIVCNNSNNSFIYDVNVSQSPPKKDTLSSEPLDSLPQSFPNYYEDEDVSVIADREEPLPSMKLKQHENYLFQSIKSMSSAEGVLQFYEEHSISMTNQHVIQVLAKLKNLVSLGREEADKIKESQIFVNLAHRVWKCSSTLDADELLRILGSLIELEVPSRSKIIQKILQLLRHSINNLNERELIHFDFLLGKLPYVGLTKMLKDSIPLLLDNLIKHDIKDDTLKLTDYSKMLSVYAKGAGSNISVLLTEIYEHGAMTADDPIKSILWNLLDAQNNLTTLTKEDNEKINVLTVECLEILSTCINQLKVGEIIATLHKLGSRKGKNNPSRNNLNFFNRVTQYITSTECRIRAYCRIISFCLRLGYVSISLNHHVIEKILESPDGVHEMTDNDFDDFIRVLAICQQDHPQLFQALDILMQHRKVQEKQINKYWLNFSLDLLALNYATEEVFSVCVDSEYIEKHFKDYSLNLVLLNESLALNNSNLRVPNEVLENGKKICLDFKHKPSKLSHILSHIFGNDQFISGVTTSEGIYINHLLIMNSSGHIEPINVKYENQRNLTENDLEIIKPSQMIAILDVPFHRTLMPGDHIISTIILKQKILTGKGYIVVTILDTVLQRLSDVEQPSFIKAQLTSVGANIV